MDLLVVQPNCIAKADFMKCVCFILCHLEHNHTVQAHITVANAARIFFLIGSHVRLLTNWANINCYSGCINEPPLPLEPELIDLSPQGGKQKGLH